MKAVKEDRYGRYGALFKREVSFKRFLWHLQSIRALMLRQKPSPNSVLQIDSCRRMS